MQRDPAASAPIPTAGGPFPPRYAPHPAAMSGDTWPVSLAEMTQQLTSRKHSSVIGGQSPYDDKVAAAAGAAALVNSAYAARVGPSAAAALPISVSARNMSLPTRAPPPMGASPPTRQWSAGWEKRGSRAPPPGPLNINKSPKLGSSRFELPHVVLHPPDDEPGAPIPLYPRPSPERAFFAPPAAGHRIIDSAPIPMPKEEAPPAVKTPPVVVRGFNAKATAVDRQGAQRGGDGFDREWDSLMEDLPSPEQRQQDAQKPPVLYPSRRAPSPPGGEASNPTATANGTSHPVARSQPVPRETPPRAPEKASGLPVAADPSKSSKPPHAMKPPVAPMAANDAPSAPAPKKSRRRSLSLSALFSKKKNRGADDVPPMPTNIPPVPPLPSKAQMAAAASAPASRPETPNSEKEKKAKRRKSFKDLFTKSSSSAEVQEVPPLPKTMRRSQSKPELRKARVTPDDAPPMPALPPKQSSSRAPTPTHVPDALAALTARSNSTKQPPVEFVPDVFAAFGSNSANNIGSVERARAAAAPPAPPLPAGPPPSSAASASIQQKQHFASSSLSLSRGIEHSGTPSGMGMAGDEGQMEVLADDKDDKREDKREEKRERRKSLSKRLSLSSLSAAFKRKKPESSTPDVPALPPGFDRAGPLQQSNARSHSSNSFDRNDYRPQDRTGSGSRSAPPGTAKMSRKVSSDNAPRLPVAAAHATAPIPARSASSPTPAPAPASVQASVDKKVPAVPSSSEKKRYSRPPLPWQMGTSEPQVGQEQNASTQDLPPRQQSMQQQRTTPQFFSSQQPEKRFPLLPSQNVSQQASQKAVKESSPDPAQQPSQQPTEPSGNTSQQQEQPRVRKVSKTQSSTASGTTESSTASGKTGPLNVVAIKPPSPTKPLNIQKRVPVPSVNDSPTRSRYIEVLEAAPVAPVAVAGGVAVVTASAAAAVASSPPAVHTKRQVSGSAPVIPATQTPSLPVQKHVVPAAGRSPSSYQISGPRPLLTKKRSAPHIRPPSEEAPGLAYLDGTDSEDNHANISIQSHATASTMMPSFSPPRSLEGVRSRKTSARDLTAAVVTESLVTDSAIKAAETPNNPDPPSPSPSMMMAAEVHTAQTARRSKFRSLNYSTEILTGSDEQGLSLRELRNVVTRGENSGIAAAGAALVGASTATVGLSLSKDGKETEVPRVDTQVSAPNDDEDDDVTPVGTSAPVVPAPVDRATITPQVMSEEPEELEDDLPDGWSKVEAQSPSSSRSPRIGVKAASDDLHDPIGHVVDIVPGSAPATLSRASAPIITSVATAPSVKHAIASTSIGLQPPPASTSPLEDVMDDARDAMDTASSYFSSAANRVGRVATGWVPSGWATAVSQRLSPSTSNPDLPSAENTTPRSPNSELPNIAAHYTSPSVESTATFESAEEGSLDSATFETFETFETYSARSARTYTPTMPPPQSSMPDLAASLQMQLPPRTRRGSMPASLAATVARRRYISTSDEDDEEEQLGEDLPHIPLTLHSSAFKSQPVRRPYTGRSSTVPNTPTTGTAPTLASLMTSEPQDLDGMEPPPRSGSSDSRSGSPLDLQMPGMFFPIDNSPFVVPFPPAGEEPTLPGSPRSPTAIFHYTPTAAARERTRRDSGITSAVGGFGFARQGPIDSVDGVPISDTPTRATNPIHYKAVVRHSLPTVVDYSRSARNSRASLGPEYAMWADIATSNIDTVLESGEPDAEESFQLDSSSSHSSGSDELDAAPCTPRTPDLDALAGMTPPSVARGKTATPTASASSRDNTPSKSPSGARAPGAGFRAMHYDMSQSSEEAANESFSTARDVPV